MGSLRMTIDIIMPPPPSPGRLSAVATGAPAAGFPRPLGTYQSPWPAHAIVLSCNGLANNQALAWVRADGASHRLVGPLSGTIPETGDVY
jgi:hypothetical protein